MRTLSTTLTAAQKSFTFVPIWKIVLSRSGQTTKGYDKTRVISITQTDGEGAEIVLNNQGNLVTSIDFEHYQVVVSYGCFTSVSRTAWATGTAYALDDIRVPTTANGYQYRCSVAGTSHATTEPTWPTDLGVTVTDNTVTWEMDGNSGDEYSRTAPMRVRAQELHSGRGILKCILRCIGMSQQMAEDKATAEYTQLSADTNTVQTLITAIAQVTLAPFTTYTSFTVNYDSTDSLIGTFVPKDYFRVNLNDNRLEKIDWLLSHTGCKRREGNDGKLHILDPTNTGTTYDYEYEFNVSGSHTFFSKSVRNRFINPNKVIAASHPDHSPQYTGSSTSATSYALDPKTQTVYRRLDSSAQAGLIAAALIEQYELDAERGFATVPMNAGQELWDYVKVTDSRQGDSKVGNIQFLQRNVKIPTGNEGLTFNMMIAFGKVTAQSLLANMITAQGEAGVPAPKLPKITKLPNITNITNITKVTVLSPTTPTTPPFDPTQLIVAIQELFDYLVDTRETLNALISAYNDLITQATVPKWHVTQQLIIPVVV